jgi:hypothetical protein
MLPALVDKLDAVAVGVKHVAGIVARIVVEPRRRSPLPVAPAAIAA